MSDTTLDLALEAVDDDACDRFGLDRKRVASIARRLSKAAREAERIGLMVFGGSGHGVLRKIGGGAQNNVADLDGYFDGGDGGDEY
jgi:hypothetical protein